MSKRRRQYRTKPASGLLKVHVFGPERPSRCAVEDVSIGGIRISFPASSAPGYSLRDVVPIEIRSEVLEEPLLVPSLVSSFSEENGKRIYGLEFIDWLGLLSRLPPPLREVFNQRRDQRVSPDPERPVTSEIHHPGSDARTPVAVLDISSMGLSFVVDSDAEEALRGREILDLSIRLPAATEALRFTASVLDWSLVPEGARCRLFFIEDPADGLERRQELLAAYVDARRREILGLPADAGSRVTA